MAMQNAIVSFSTIFHLCIKCFFIVMLVHMCARKLDYYASQVLNCSCNRHLPINILVIWPTFLELDYKERFNSLVAPQVLPSITIRQALLSNVDVDPQLLPSLIIPQALPSIVVR